MILKGVFLIEKKCIPDFGQGMFYKMCYKTERISRAKLDDFEMI